MRFRIEYIGEGDEQEIILRCFRMDENIRKQCTAIENLLDERPTIVYYKGDREFYLPSREVLFFETGGNETVYANTSKDVFKVNHRLYQLENLLPPEFMRVSKSTIVNTVRILSLTRNLSATTAQFIGSHKEVHVSRHYFKALKEQLSQRRLSS